MNTAAEITRIKKLQGVLSALALLNINGSMYSKEANVCDGATYDYIVVGAGTAGVIVAARLVEANYSTLLVQAGGNCGIECEFPGLVTYVKNSRLDWNYTSEGDDFTGKCHKKGGSLLGKVLGGRGAINFMIYGRGNSRDYEKFYKATNDSSWTWKNMLKWFKKTENLHDPNVLKSAFGKYHSSKGTIGVIKENRPVCDDYLIGFEEAGESVVVDNIGTGKGYSSAMYNIFEGIRTEGASTYLPPLKDNPKLQITRNSLATKIIFDENKNAIGVEIVKNGKTVTAKAKKEVIVCAGPIKSSQLLLLSGIGPKEDLEDMNIDVISDLPVGKNLQNIVGAMLAFRTKRPANPKPFNAHKFQAPLIVGYTACNKSSYQPDYETLNFIMDDASYFLAFCGFTLGFENSICDRLHTLAENTQMLVSVVSNINPKSRGEVKLNSTDPFDQPRIFNRYYSNDDDLDAVVDYMIDYIKIEGTPHFQSLGLEFLRATEKCKKFTFGSRAYWRCCALCMIATTGRNVGTCSMGSVVDTKLKVMGVNRLRVVGASAMPNTIGSPIYGSEVAFAEKGVAIIIKESRQL